METAFNHVKSKANNGPSSQVLQLHYILQTIFTILDTEANSRYRFLERPAERDKVCSVVSPAQLRATPAMRPRRVWWAWKAKRVEFVRLLSLDGVVPSMLLNLSYRISLVGLWSLGVMELGLRQCGFKESCFGITCAALRCNGTWHQSDC